MADYGSSYIYFIIDPKSRCYVGQATDTGKGEFHRIWEHIEAAYKNKSGDESVILIQDWPLTKLVFGFFGENDAEGRYGISEKVYNTFLNYFSPTGKRKIQEERSKKNKETGKREKTGESTVIKIKTAEKINEEDTYSRGEYLDMAEIIWMSRFQAAGFKVLNKSIGGQTSKWSFTGLNGDENVNINTSSPEMLTSMLISTDATTAGNGLLKQMQEEIDNLCNQYLNANLARLLETQIKNSAESRKNLLNNPKWKNKDSIPLKSILNDAISKVLSGKGTGKDLKFKEDLDAIINKYASLGLTQLSIAPDFSNVLSESIIENITKKIANSLLETFQSKKLRKVWSYNLTFNIVNDQISYKGQGGSLINSPDSQTISVSLDQTLMFAGGYNNSGSWWFKKPNPNMTNQVSEDFLWKSTKKVFKYWLARVANSEYGIMAKAEREEGNPEEIGDRLIFSVTLEDVDNTLSSRMKTKYREILGYNNGIFSNWPSFYSALYASVTKQSWTEFNGYAILNDEISIENENYLVGFGLDDSGTKPDFETKRDNYAGIIF